MSIDLEKLVNEVKKDMDEVGVPYNPNIPVSITSRYPKSLGKCYYKFINDKRVASEIKISKQLYDFRDIKLLKNTICHELIHSADDCVYSNHGGYWLYYSKLMNKYKGYNISRLTDLPEEMLNQYKYIIICKECGAKGYYSRYSQSIKLIEANSKDIYCKYCGNHRFKIIRNK